MELVVGLFMVVMGVGIAGIWTVDIARSPEVDRTSGLLRARERSNGSLLAPHWIAEYATAMLLVIGGLGLLLANGSGPWTLAVPVSLGALGYTSCNSLGWVLADRSRTGYAIPMAVGLVGAIAGLALILAGAVATPM